MVIRRTALVLIPACILVLSCSRRNSQTQASHIKVVPVWIKAPADTANEDWFGSSLEVALLPESMVVSDRGRDRVIQMDYSGEIIRQIGNRGNGPGEYAHARGVASSLDEQVFVDAGFSARLIQYDSEGEFIQVIDHTSTIAESGFGGNSPCPIQGNRFVYQAAPRRQILKGTEAEPIPIALMVEEATVRLLGTRVLPDAIRDARIRYLDLFRTDPVYSLGVGRIVHSNDPETAYFVSVAYPFRISILGMDGSQRDLDYCTDCVTADPLIIHQHLPAGEYSEYLSQFPSKIYLASESGSGTRDFVTFRYRLAGIAVGNEEVFVLVDETEGDAADGFGHSFRVYVVGLRTLRLESVSEPIEYAVDSLWGLTAQGLLVMTVRGPSPGIGLFRVVDSNRSE